MPSSSTEVVIIGAGPTGLFTACELARHGVRPRILERCAEPHNQTRATGVQPASLELMARAGIAGPVVEGGVRMRGLRIWDRAMGEVFTHCPPPPDSPFPFGVAIPQWRTEEILTTHLCSFGVEVERGVAVEGITVRQDGARVDCTGPDGSRSVIEAAWLVGAGGAHSPVRGALHEDLEGLTYPRQFLVADVRTDLPRGEELLGLVIAPAGLVMVVELPDGRTLVVTDLDDGPRLEAPRLADLERALASHLARPFAVGDLRWISCYKTHRRMAPRFAGGRCFLAGDAAHLCSPFGGEGMNSGFLDGASLAWMLAAVLRRGARPSLLEAYAPERSAVARQVLESSDFISAFYYGMVDQARAGLPIAPPPPDGRLEVTSPHMLDVVLGPSPLIGSHGPGTFDGPVRPGARFPERVQLKGCLHHLLVFGRIDGDTAFAGRWRDVLEMIDGGEICAPERAGVPAGGAVLVRPDGCIGFQTAAWSPAAREALDGHLARHFVPQA